MAHLIIPDTKAFYFRQISRVLFPLLASARSLLHVVFPLWLVRNSASVKVWILNCPLSRYPYTGKLRPCSQHRLEFVEGGTAAEGGQVGRVAASVCHGSSLLPSSSVTSLQKKTSQSSRC